MKQRIVNVFISLVVIVSGHSALAAAVATSSPYATDVAQRILQDGGSAVDAACAAQFALNVTQSYFTGIGGGGFAVVQDSSGLQRFFDFRDQAPAGTNSRLFYGKDGKIIESWSARNTGPQSVAIPGFVAGCGELHKKYGRLTWKQVIKPAVELAKNGYIISQMYQEEEADQLSRLLKFEPTKSIFGGVTGTGLKKGEIFKQPLLEKTLEFLSEHDASSFYRGEFAQGWLKEARSLGDEPAEKIGITESDLSNYHASQRDPVRFNFGHAILGRYEAATADLPSSAGLTVGATLRYIVSYYTKHHVPKPDSAERYIVDIEAMQYFAEMRDKMLSDRARAKLTPSVYIGSRQEVADFKAIDKRVAARLIKISALASPLKNKSTTSPSPVHQTHTANVSVLDDQGMAIALTNSVGSIYGSALTVPAYGFVLNSHMGDFDPNSDSINAPAPGMRPRSNMSPTLIYEVVKGKKDLVGVIGGAGGPIIPTAIVQFVENLYLHKMSPSDALATARIFPNDANQIDVEKSMTKETLASLKAAGYEAAPTDTIWAIIEAVVRPNSSSAWVAIADARYDGKAVSSLVH